MKKSVTVFLGFGGGLVIASLIGLAVTGRKIGWGPFRFLFQGWEKEVAAIEQRYDAECRKGEILFYGASNFRLWTEMESDLAPYPVQNHGFGGSTDVDLVAYADRLLYPYEPRLAFFQTGSNDYVQRSGTDEQKIAACMAYKKEMFEAFHKKLPKTKFVVLSGLLLPGRSQYTPLTQEINRQLKALCEAHPDYMCFVDAQALTYDGTSYRTELFSKDQIHLNHEGQLLWRDGYILPTLERMEQEVQP